MATKDCIMGRVFLGYLGYQTHFSGRSCLLKPHKIQKKIVFILEIERMYSAQFQSANQ
jgi:hypothetical protein